MRSMVSTAKGGRPPMASALGAKGWIRTTYSVHCTRFISSRNTHLRVLLVTNSNPVVARLICYIGIQRFSGLSGWLGFAEIH